MWIIIRNTLIFFSYEIFFLRIFAEYLDFSYFSTYMQIDYKNVKK